MSIPTYTTNSMGDFTQRWYDAENLNPTELKKLYSDTDQLAEFLEKGEGISQDEISQLANSLIKGFEQHGIGEVEKFAQLLAKLTTYSEKESEIEGAYKPIHHLFKAIVKVEGYPSDYFEKASTDDVEFANIVYIDAASRGYMEKSKKSIIPQTVSKDSFTGIEDPILHRLGTKELATMASTSKKNKEMAKPILIDRLNKGEATFNDIGIKTIDGIRNFFGESTGKIFILDLIQFSPIEDNDVKKIADSFPNLLTLRLNKPKLTGKSEIFFNKMGESLKELNLINCRQIVNFDFLKGLKSLETLNLYSSGIRDVSFLQDLKSLKFLSVKDTDCKNLLKPLQNLALERLCLSNSACTEKALNSLKCLSSLKELELEATGGILGTFLHKCSSLKKLDFSQHPSATDFSFLPFLNSIETLNLRGCTKFTDVDLLLNLSSLKTLDVRGTSLNRNDLQLLQDRGIKLMEDKPIIIL